MQSSLDYIWIIIGGTGATRGRSTMKSDTAALPIADRVFAYTIQLVLAFIFLPVLSSGHPLQQSMPKSPNDQSSATARRDNGSITGSRSRTYARFLLDRP